MTKTEAKKQVTHFAKSYGLSVNGKNGIPLLARGDWLYCADDWIDAYDYLNKARLAHINHSLPFPWASSLTDSERKFYSGFGPWTEL